ncbi:MAG TPA: multicopper oxidase domain-containing protein [Microthrixaceae bacterium]|nr:multicopper oxidase domain-containing protein [Microthrixaceae bacterium]
MAEKSEQSHGVLFLYGVGFLIVYLLGIGAIVAAAAIWGGGDSSSAEESASTTVAVELSEFKIEGDLSAPAGEVALDVTNSGTVDHNVAVEGTELTTATLGAGDSQTLELGDLEVGEYTLFCSIPGHKDSGMSATLVVTEGGSDGSHVMPDGSTMTDGEMASDTGSTPDYSKMDADMLASFAAFPAATEGVGNQPLEPTILPDGTKQFELTAQITKWEVEPGKVVDAWTYNGTVPAPMIRLEVGDRVRVLFHNDLPVSQDIHWHGIRTPFAMDGVAPITQEPVGPDGDFVYEFTVDQPYQGMYHPHLHGQMGVPNGMWGVIQVGETPLARGQTVAGVTIPDDVQPAVDMPMVVNDAGAIGLSLNGKSFPATAPIVVNQGDWVALTYYNEGLQTHPMHLHQFPQLVTAKDGIPLDNPYWVDTLNVAPGERYTVLFHADLAGTWAFHCHILTHAERESGMFGMVTAVVVQ